MRTCFLLFAAAAALLHGAAALEVVDLTPTEVDGWVKDVGSAFILFYAPWCEKSKAFQPLFERAALDSDDWEGAVPLARVDMTLEGNEDVAATWQVAKFPSLRFVRDDEWQVYDGSLGHKSLTRFLRRMVGPVMPVLANDREAMEFAFFRGTPDGSLEPVVMLYTPNGKDIPLYEPTEQAAEAIRVQTRFAQTSDAAVAKLFQLPQDKEALFIVREWDEMVSVYDGPLAAGAIVDWAKAFARPVAVVADKINLRNLQRTGVRFWLHAFLPTAMMKDSAAINALKADLLQAAKQEFAAAGGFNRGELTIALSDGEEYALWPADYNLTASDLPRLTALNLITRHRWVVTPSDDAPAQLPDALRGFFARMRTDAAESERFFKSAPAVEERNALVPHVNAALWKQTVMDNDHDVLVFFFKEWCSHCHVLMERFEEVARLYSDVQSLRFYRLDLDMNDVPHDKVVVRGFPAVAMFAAGNKGEPVWWDRNAKYDDNSATEALTTFARVHASQVPIALGSKEEL